MGCQGVRGLAEQKETKKKEDNKARRQGEMQSLDRTQTSEKENVD